jgi:TonB family protein
MKKFLPILPVLFLLCAFQSVSAQKKKAAGGIVNGRAVYLPKPEYLQEAKDFCAGGKVEVKVLIDENGNVISAGAISGDELLRNSSVEAARKARFKTGDFPARIEGIVVYDFSSQAKCIDAGIVNRKAVRLPKPEYPKASKFRPTGSVRVRILINEEGNVESAKIISGHPFFHAEAIKAALKAKFYPTNDVGKIRIKGILVYKFSPKSNLNQNFNHSVFNRDFVRFNRAIRRRKTRPAADIEAPAVKVAFDDVSVKPRIGKRIAFVRAEIFDGVKFPIHVKKRNFRAVL